MMKKLDQRGVAALEFCLVAVVFFTTVFAIFDLGRYAITVQSLRTLANTGARQMMIKCYTPAVIASTSPSGCTDINTYFPSTDRPDAAPFLYGTGPNPTPTLSATSGGSALTVTASVGFTTTMPIWGAVLNTPSASTSVPF